MLVCGPALRTCAHRKFAFALLRPNMAVRRSDSTDSLSALRPMSINCSMSRNRMLAVGLVRSEASAERLRKAGGEPLTGTVDDLDVLAKAAAAGEKLGFPVIA